MTENNTLINRQLNRGLLDKNNIFIRADNQKIEEFLNISGNQDSFDWE
jgi:hypothetical protein